MSKLIFVSHSPCRDGNTASYVANLRFNNEAEYLRESHGGYLTTNKLLTRKDVHDCHIIFLDICPPRDLLIALHERAAILEVWDHHKTAEEDCGDLPYVHIDNDKSGASLTWAKLYPDEPVPLLIRAVEAGDLWKWERCPDASLICMYLETQKFSFKRWGELHKMLESEDGKKTILDTAASFKLYRDHLIRMIITNRKIHWIHFNKMGIKMPAINCPTMQSNLGNALCHRKDHQGGAIYYRGNGQYYFSLRSTAQGPDVSEIARKYGGGGHRNASGFVCKSLKQLDLGTPGLADLPIGEYLKTVEDHDVCFSEMTDAEIQTLFPDIELE